VQDSLDVSQNMLQNKLGQMTRASLAASSLTKGTPKRVMGASQNYIANSSKKHPTKFEGIVPAIQPAMSPSTTTRRDDDALS
jgi:hypothetical protein